MGRFRGNSVHKISSELLESLCVINKNGGVIFKSEIINGKEYREVEIRGRTKFIAKDGSAINPYKRNQKVSIHYNQDGYPCFGGGIPVHMYVAHGWVDGHFDGAEVNHIDYDRTNYNADNLEWTTHKDNVLHSAKIGHYRGKDGEKNPNYNNHKLHYFYSEHPDIAIQKLGRRGKQNGRARSVKIVQFPNLVFDTVGDCAKWLINNGYSNSTVKSIRQSIITSIKNHRYYLGLLYEYV